jgi:hypothetical protein
MPRRKPRTQGGKLWNKSGMRVREETILAARKRGKNIGPEKKALV